MSKAKPPEVPTIGFANPQERRVGLLLSEEEKNKQLREWAEEDRLKLVRLAREVYDIPDGPEQFYLLALALARIQHPGKNKVGRPSKWNSFNQGIVVAEVERLLKGRDNLKSACFKISGKEPWKSFLAGDKAPDQALLRVYHNFREDPRADAARYAFKFCELTGGLEEWDRHVNSLVKKL